MYDRTHEVSEWPRALRDHVVAIEWDIERSIENVGIGEINKKVIGRRSHSTMRKNNPYNNTVATGSQQNDHGKEEQVDELKTCIDETDLEKRVCYLYGDRQS